MLGSLPWDPPSAAVFSAGAHPGRRFARGPLLRGLQEVAEAVTARIARQSAELGDQDADLARLKEATG